MNGERASVALASLADATRRAIFEHLCHAPHAVGELASKLPVTRSAVSQHLKVLKQSGLVREQRAGKRRIYSSEPAAVSAVAEYAGTLRAHAAVPSLGGQAPALARSAQAAAHEQTTDRVDSLLAQWPGPMGQDADGVALITRLLLIGRVMEKLLARACATHGISKVDMIILGTLCRLPPPHESVPSHLSRIAVLSPPGITKRLDHLQRRKLIVRRAGCGDRRTQVIRLTAEGRRVYDEIARYNLSQNYGAIFALEAPVRTQLNCILRDLLRQLEERLEAEHA